MLSNYVMPGDRVEMMPVRVRQSAGGADEEQKVYKSQVFEILSEDRLEIMMPMEKAKLVLLPVDSEYVLDFYTSNGLYRCRACITERYKSGNIYLLALELTGSLKKRQRREYYRYDCVIDLGIRPLNEEEIKEIKAHNRIDLPGIDVGKGVIVDISGGGIRAVTDIPFEAESVLYLHFTLTNSSGPREYRLAGRLLSIRELENKPGSYEGRIQFLNMDAKEREEIIKFIFEEERKQRQREKG